MPDKDFIIVALDLLSGVTQGLGSNTAALMDIYGQNLLTLLSVCLKDPNSEVRQSAYALLGDLSISVFASLKPHINQIMPEVISQIEVNVDPMRISVCNNAIWASGEIAIKHGIKMYNWL